MNEIDRELLELAAKAVGICGEFVTNYDGGYYYEGETDGILYSLHDGQYYVWNPIADDGDALRLAVKLRMSVTVFDNAVGIGIKGSFGYREYEITPGPYAATRRAIVRAAAEIGRSMK